MEVKYFADYIASKISSSRLKTITSELAAAAQQNVCIQLVTLQIDKIAELQMRAINRCGVFPLMHALMTTFALYFNKPLCHKICNLLKQKLPSWLQCDKEEVRMELYLFLGLIFNFIDYFSDCYVIFNWNLIRRHF